MLSLGPFSVKYPVNFRSGGDTTKDAFWKHIQEIERIYGLLTAIDAAAASSDSISGAISGELQQHINSTNPHPNWKPSLSFDDITGNLAASRVRGNLTNATIDASRVNGLADKIPSVPDLQNVFPSVNIQENGYIKFINGFMLQWGKGKEMSREEFSGTQTENFPIGFENDCLGVFVTGIYGKITNRSNRSNNFYVQVESMSRSSFSYDEWGMYTDFYGSGYEGKFYIKYLAIGY